MNTLEFLHILNNPNDLQSNQALELEDIVMNFPFFQAARVLHLKSLKMQHDFRYNEALKTTAIHTTDRSVLFEFITTDEFNNIISQEEENEIISQIEVVDEMVILNLEKEVAQKQEEEKPVLEDSINLSYKVNEKGETSLNAPKDDEVVVNMELIKAIQFRKNEKHSFNQWLQLSSFKPIDRSKPSPVTAGKSKNRDIIDEFITNKPKIKPQEKPSKLAGLRVDVDYDEEIESDSMMTETLAKLYIKQRKYYEAILAYEILSLKIPEKSSFFADRINEIKELMR